MDEILSEFFWGTPGMLVPWFPMFWNFLYVSQSVSWITLLPKLDKNRDISSSDWYIFLKFLEDIPGMLVHLLQMILNVSYVCQSGSWHTFLMKSNKLWDISSSGWDIFLIFYGHIPGMLVHLLQIIPKF